MALKTLRRWRKKVTTSVALFWEFLVFCYTSILELLYEGTLPVTKRLFSRKPKPPVVTVKDIRANRIRLNIESSFASPFNVEEFEVEWAEVGSDDWQTVGRSDLTQRTVARLKPDKAYQFRVRASNQKGTSDWSSPIQEKTKLDPCDGGGYGPGYIWAQTPSDVTITFEIPNGSTKRDIRLALKPDSLLVELMAVGSARVLLEGELYGRVSSWENGSFWELIKEDGKTYLILTLEKQTKSLAPKFDYWRSVVVGHPEIDTHKIVSDSQGTQMLQPSQMDPMQLQRMGMMGMGMGM